MAEHPMDQATRTAIATFHRYILACGDDRWPTAEALAMGGPEACWALCQQLLRLYVPHAGLAHQGTRGA